MATADNLKIAPHLVNSSQSCAITSNSPQRSLSLSPPSNSNINSNNPLSISHTQSLVDSASPCASAAVNAAASVCAASSSAAARHFADLDCGLATRKRPLDLYEEPESADRARDRDRDRESDLYSENSPKRHNMEDELCGEIVSESGVGVGDYGSSSSSSASTLAYLNDPTDENKYQLKMTIPSYAAGCIIGKGGTTIVETQKNFHAVIKLSKANECYPYTKERVVLIVGSMKALQQSGKFIQEKVREAVDLFGQKLTDENPPAEQRANMCKVLIPHSTVGMLIGRMGATQKQIQAETGVRMEFSPKPDFSPIMERCLTLSGSAIQINTALDRVLEKIKADPQSGSCPNLVYNMTGLPGSLNGMIDPNYAAAASALNIDNLMLKLAYASASAASPYALAPNAAAAAFAYPGAYLTAGNPAANAMYPNALTSQSMLDQQTAALYASMGIHVPGFPVANQQSLLLSQQAASPQPASHRGAGAAHMQKEGPPISSLAGNPLIGANLAQAQQNQLLANAGLIPGGTGSFLANNSTGALVGGNTHSPSASLAQGAAGVYMTSLPTNSQANPAGVKATQGPVSVPNMDPQSQLNSAASMQAALLQQQAAAGFLGAFDANGALTMGMGGHGHRGTVAEQPAGLVIGNNVQQSAGNITQHFDVAENIIGAVIGFAGKTLVEIQNLSGSRVQISPKGEPSTELRRLSISGTQHAVLNARILIEQRIQRTEELRAIQGKVTV